MPVQDIDGLLAWLPDELFMSFSLWTSDDRWCSNVLPFYLSSGRNLFHETLRVEILKPRSAEGFASMFASISMDGKPVQVLELCQKLEEEVRCSVLMATMGSWFSVVSVFSTSWVYTATSCVVTRPKRLLSNLTSGRQGYQGCLNECGIFNHRAVLESLESRVERMVMHREGAGPPQAWAGVIAKSWRHVAFECF